MTLCPHSAAASKVSTGKRLEPERHLSDNSSRTRGGTVALPLPGFLTHRDWKRPARCKRASRTGSRSTGHGVGDQAADAFGGLDEAAVGEVCTAGGGGMPVATSIWLTRGWFSLATTA